MNEVRLRLSITPTRIEVRQFSRSGNAFGKFLYTFARSYPVGNNGTRQKIHTMEKKPFEAPEVKVMEIRPRSIIALSPCTGDACITDIPCLEDVCVNVHCVIVCSEY